MIDTSALVAILLGEPEAERLAAAIAADPIRLASAFSALEAGIVVEARRGDAAGRDLDLLLHRCGIELVPLTASQHEVARHAWRRFGRGRQPAALNIGDCCSCALAKTSGEPLLFAGGDFARTDLPAARD